jgi:hypothetical protein
MVETNMSIKQAILIIGIAAVMPSATYAQGTVPGAERGAHEGGEAAGRWVLSSVARSERLPERSAACSACRTNGNASRKLFTDPTATAIPRRCIARIAVEAVRQHVIIQSAVAG